MRSIRRSLLGYLLLLLALAIGAVGVLVDRFANAAVRARASSETERIEQTYKVRQQEAKAKFDAELLTETKSLAKEVPYKMADILGQKIRRGGPPKTPEPPIKAPEDEARRYRTQTAFMEFAAPPAVLPTLLTFFALEPRIDTRPGGVNDPRRSNPFPGWVEYDAPRMVGRIQELLRKTFDDNDPPGYIQFTFVVSYHGRPSATTLAIQPTHTGSAA